MLDKTKEKFLRKALRELERLAFKRRVAIETDNGRNCLTPQARVVARALANETSEIFKGFKQVYLLTGIDYKSDPEYDLEDQTEYIKATSEDQIIGFNVEATIKAVITKESKINGNKIDYISKPRGNPQKGGMVKKLISLGLSSVEASNKADDLLNQGITVINPKEIMGFISNNSQDSGQPDVNFVPAPYIPIESPTGAPISLEEAKKLVFGEKKSRDQILMDSFMDDEDKEYMAQQAIEINKEITENKHNIVTEPKSRINEGDLGALDISNEDPNVPDF